MPFVIRPARIADVSAIVALHRLPHVAARLSVPTEEQVRSGLEVPDERDFVVERDGSVAGSVRCIVSDGWLIEIRRVIAGVPRIGLGRFMMREILRWAFERESAHRVFLETEASNLKARRLYESLGFVHEGTWRDGYRHADGTFRDLCAYGLLAAEYASHVADRLASGHGDRLP